MQFSHKFFQNTGCKYFPCHCSDEIENFNCLFCFCPLYTLGEKCGGDFVYTSGGVKDCSGCLFPHIAENYSVICERLEQSSIGRFDAQL